MAPKTLQNVRCQIGKKTHAVCIFEGFTLYVERNRSAVFCSKLSLCKHDPEFAGLIFDL